MANPPDYPTWKGYEDVVQEGFEAAGLTLEEQPHFGARPDFALCGENERFLCFLEVKSGEFDDPTQAEMHLAVARQSQWKELHYFTPDGTDAEFSQRTKDVLARATDVRVVFHPVDDAARFQQSVSELGARVAAARGPHESPAGGPEAGPDAAGPSLDAHHVLDARPEGPGAEAVTDGLVEMVSDVVEGVIETVKKLGEH
ncbi:MAG: hypothetical protein QOE27_177 [Solirubrobacteraceae bacterium]|jgi:hypothetical protein|nr:hypothetical protein [Solirubrobacteraceae bacterium]